MLNFKPETVSTEIDPQDPKVRVVKTVLSTTTVQVCQSHNWQRYGEYIRLRAVAYMQRMVQDKPWKLKTKWEQKLTAQDLQNAKKTVI